MNRTIAFMMILLGAGCGDDAPSDDKPISEFTESEARAACEDLMDELPEGEARTFACNFQALILANGSVEQCNMLRDQCLMMPAMEGGMPDSCDDVDTSDVTDCSATYGELKTCLSKASEAYQSFARSLNCSLADDEGAFEEMSSSSSPSNIRECMTLEMKCPGFLGGDDDDDGGV